MNTVIPDFSPALPEIFMLTMGCVVLMAELFIKQEDRSFIYLLTQVTLAVTAVLTVLSFTGASVTTFSGSFINDSMAVLLKLCIYLVSFVVFLYSRDYMMQRGIFKGEFLALGLFSVLGMMVLISAGSLLTVYLGLELMSLCLYAMVALQRDSKKATEAAMKYFILGALSSGLLLYGMSILYGMTGSLLITEIAQYIQAVDGSDVVLSLALVFILIGIVFKLGAVPFHMWVPDVYHGAPTSVTLFIAAAPKLAAFAMLMRLIVGGLEGLHAEWGQMFIVLAVLSIAVGNIIAIAQSNIKRMFAYSGIAHVGFILLALLTGTEEGYAAALFYTVAYVIMTVGGFGMILLLSRQGIEADQLDDFKGLNKRNPWFAFVMLILMLSMAGIPLTLGFFAKLSVLTSVVHVELVWLAVIAVLLAVIGAFYYLRVIKLIYFDAPEGDVMPLESTVDMRVMLSINGVAVLLFGIFPHQLIALCSLVI